MQPHVSVLPQEILHARGLVTADVVADHMDLLFGPLAGYNVGEEGHELLAGMARRHLARARGTVVTTAGPTVVSTVTSAAFPLSVMPTYLFSRLPLHPPAPPVWLGAAAPGSGSAVPGRLAAAYRRDFRAC